MIASAKRLPEEDFSSVSLHVYRDCMVSNLLTYWVVHPKDWENEDVKFMRAVELGGKFFAGNFTFAL